MSAYILICEHPCIDLSSEARINVITCLHVSIVHSNVKHVKTCT